MRRKIGETIAKENRPPAIIVWLSYQRRAEVLAPLLDCDGVTYFPHLFKSRNLRLLDYFFKLLRTTVFLLRKKPSFVILQAPPLFSALAALITRTPYVVDVHNAMVQSYWSKIPMTPTFMRRAAVLIAHNFEVVELIQKEFPQSKVVTISDPVAMIGTELIPRSNETILFICSFDRDEPLKLIIEVIEALPEFKFTITANVRRLPPELQVRYLACKNLHLVGFLSIEAYQSLLCSCKAAVVLSVLPSVQPSGAVEALSSNTPLIVSRSSLTTSLFGDWAILVDNELGSLVKAISSISDTSLDLTCHRDQWNEAVDQGIIKLRRYLDVPRA